MKLHREFPLHMMLLPSVIFTLIFAYVPMIGNKIAFEHYNPGKGILGNQTWVGWENFVYMFNLPDIKLVIWNTIFISLLKIIACLVIPIIVAILLNEVSNSSLKKSIQTMIYLPNFISWVIMSGIIVEMLSPSEGLVNGVLKFLGMQPIFFLADNKWFVPTIVITDLWKNFGFSTIIYLASICGIDPGQYESAYIDGAGKWKQVVHVTLPGMKGIIVLMGVLSLGNILNAGFDQIFNLLNPAVNQTGMVLDVFIYNIGIGNAQYSVATAIGLFRSLVTAFFLGTSWFLAHKIAKYRIF